MFSVMKRSTSTSATGSLRLCLKLMLEKFLQKSSGSRSKTNLDYTFMKASMARRGLADSVFGQLSGMMKMAYWSS